MKLINITNGAVLANMVQIADDFKTRLKGLIGRGGLKSDEALIIRPCKSVHTCFMRFPIDVIFLNEDLYILRIIENIQPYRFSPIVAGSRMVIEMPAGRLAATLTGVGHRIKLL
ncbi:hypothetical protein Psch_00529 [Pelotomaculum schinkii]|uniref:ACR n=1 Tax=Pelotomaculum schinkii TaxID=78350 RepID=A0A4Y7RDZ3_9FIRM|nr:DUF192 domain-containing protein [Pelotomaculum schinkii]TEB06991.1 hypothetical protein Psch_00529 [Pelotomaculum schinkii]